MPVLINLKICDNSSECSGIPVCPVKAITWNEKKKTLEIDNKKCISCDLCEKACPVGAIRVAKTPEEFKKIEKEIKEDTRKISDLFIDRYGAQPIHEAFLDKEENFDNLIKISKIPIVLELFNGNSIKCLLYSIQHHPLKPSKLHFVAPPIIPPGIAPPQALISGAPGMHADMLGGTALPSGPRRSRPPLRSAGIELIAPVARTTPRPCGCLSLAPSRSIR